MKPVTLYDVADYAGVSYQTVSRVVNGASHVSSRTREKVNAAMSALNYIPNRVAQQLAGKNAPLIGVVTTTLALHAPSQIVAAIKSRADHAAASVVISMVEHSGVAACNAAVRSLMAQRVTGIIINYPLDEPAAAEVATACDTVPVLFLDVPQQAAVNHIVFCHDDGARLGVEQLIQHGHRHIALLSGPHHAVASRLRLVGWHHALAQHGITPSIEMAGDWSAMSGFLQTQQMLNNGTVPTAMLIANDQMALGAMRAISESGRRVAADISVIGYDDTDDSACFTPPLTTIRQDFRLLGENSVDQILALSRGEQASVRQVLPVALVSRKTVLPPAAQGGSPQVLADALMQLAQQVAQLAN
ncbi:LacI family DNA-binding transcriptional regulator [Shimwellia pseudoproteus]|uniref:LacI family DNA-binding transcriptional regulator n=1 Tax=Shimwellia pseudoproteus TaxID=570012 RepID=UPI0018ECD367|nr:LacI family DNA-binding transcriptional regulator [Shimwellia pseudoproteus]MBJ3816825.1 LacI family DNA-binding transcriptional regulator [Shimwellia pseudoproteus]